MQPTTIGDTFDDAPANTNPRAHRRTREPVRTSELVGDGTIPPAEPRVRQAAEPTPAAAPATLATTRILPEALTHGIPAERVETGFWYWIGLLPGAPCASVDVAGTSFQRTTEAAFVNVRDASVQERVPISGEILRLSREKVQEIAAAVARRGVRFVHAGNSEAERKRASEGYTMPLGAVVRYSSQAEIDAARAAGRLAVPVLPRGGDRPLGDFLFCQIIKEDCPRPRWAGQYDLPSPISQVGIELPAPDAIAPPPGARVNFARTEGMVLWNANSWSA